MRTDENGSPCPETLGEYRDLIAALLGEHNRAIQFLDQKISESPDGKDEVVVAPDSQMRLLLAPMMVQPAE